MSKEIPLTKGMRTIVDECDYHWLSQTKWQYNERGYATGDIFGGRKSAGKVLMHRLILLAPNTCTVDHINHNTLDNRRCNLRLATQAQQNANRMITKGRSKYKGVYRRRDGLKWCAQIKSEGRQRYIGSFVTEEEAAQAYNEQAKILFGEFAYLNKL